MTSVGLGRGFRTDPADAARCLTCASRAVDGRGTRSAVVFWPIVLEPLEQDLANGPGGSDAPAMAIIWSWMRESDELRAEPSSTCAGPGCDGSNGHIAASRLDELGIGSWLARCSSVPGFSVRCITTMPWGRHGAYAVCSPRAVRPDGSCASPIFQSGRKRKFDESDASFISRVADD